MCFIRAYLSRQREAVGQVGNAHNSKGWSGDHSGISGDSECRGLMKLTSEVEDFNWGWAHQERSPTDLNVSVSTLLYIREHVHLAHPKPIGEIHDTG